MVGTCKCCGVAEHLDLLDSKFDPVSRLHKVYCVVCYGFGWQPASIASLARSICDKLKPHYDLVRKQLVMVH